MEEPERTCSRCGARYGQDVIFCPKDGTPLGEKKTEIVEDPYLGILLAEQFRIEQLIGIGAMGRVYRAHQRGIERPVAVKIIHRDLLRNPTVMLRFQREARVASRLSHPNVVQVLTTGEVGKQGPDVGGEAYLVMEYLDGISLRSALAASGGAMPLPRALHIVLQVCDAVGEAHAQAIVHRDVKPENVMLVKRGDDSDYVKVLDFGVARIEGQDGSVATQAGVIFGTARYISPEGAQGKTVGPPSDVYSIAVILFQCLSGQPPFDADNPVGILIKHTNEPAPDVRSIARSSYVPEPIARVLDANLSKNPSDRCRDARDLGRALVDAVRQSGLSPDDLVVRSTLLGGGARALQMQSLQRTKSLALSNDLAQRMAGKTEIGDASGEPLLPGEPTMADAPSVPDATLSDVPSDSLTSAPVSDPVRPAETRLDDGPELGDSAPRLPLASSPESALSSAPPLPELSRPSRPSGVEPTMSDEPVSELLSGPHAAAPPSFAPSSGTGTHHQSFPPSEPRPSFPDSGWAPAEDTVSPVRRWLLVAACFLVGAALALFVAQRLGAFAPKTSEPSASSYADRARAAMSRQAWDEPPGENVRDITTGALRRWPGARDVVEVRESAARDLVEKSKSLGADRPNALRWAKLAVELDPKNEAAQTLLAELSREPDPEPTPSVAPPSPEPAESPSEPRVRAPATPGIKEAPAKTAPAPAKGATKPAPSAKPAGAPTFAEPPPAAPTTTAPGGRWL